MLNMNPEVRTLWVEALRSGTYSQSREILEDTKGFCCLGVLCRLAADRGICDRTEAANGSIMYDTENNFLPERVREWAGLYMVNPTTELTEHTLYGPGEDTNELITVSLATLNDEYHFTFEQIADVIEGKLT